MVETLTTDGRTARRERGRTAVIDAALDLAQEGHIPPPVAEVAQRAGVSVASVFRYFATLDELQECAIERFLDRYAHLFEVPGLGEGTSANRVQRFVAARVRLLGTIAPLMTLARARSVDLERVADAVQSVRSTMAAQTADHFRPELDRRSPAAAADLVAVVDVLTSVEAWQTMRTSHGRTPRQIRRAWVAALTRLLESEAP